MRDATRFEEPVLPFVSYDMRKLFAKEYFDCVFNLFTSFGLFNKPEHANVVMNLAAAVSKGGLLVLDYVNNRHSVNV